MSAVDRLAPGDALGPLEVAVDRAAIRAYADASGDANPIHLDDAAARRLGLPGVIAHGMWTMGVALRLVTDAVPGAPVRHAFCRFGRPLILPADGSATLRVTGTVTAVEAGTATVALECHARIGEADERIAKLEVRVG